MRKPAPVLVGLGVGVVGTLFAGIYLWFFALLLPLVVGGASVVFARTRAFGLGVLAAACGSVVFLLTLALLFTVF